MARRLALPFAVVLLAACSGTCSLGASSSSTGPGAENLVSAQLQGAWELTASVDSFTGPAGQHFLPVGHMGTDQVWFKSACTGLGHCTLQIWGPSGPDSSQETFFQFTSRISGFEAPPVSTPLTQSGSTFSGEVPVSGYGGPVPCEPPPRTNVPAQELTLRTTRATLGTAGWSATKIIGAETLLTGWGCSGSTPTGWVTAHLGIAGHKL